MRRAGAGQHDQVGVGERAGVGREDDVEVGLEPERVDVGEVADPRQPDHRDLAAPVARVGPPAVEVEGVLGVEPEVGVPRQHAVHPPAGQRARARRRPGLEQATRRRGTC